MLSLKLFIFLLIGTAAMLIPIMILAARYHIKQWKSVLISVVLTVTGTLGTYLMFFIENHRFGGISFFGAVFLVPLVFPLAAKLLRISYGELMDLCAPAECVMLAIMKVNCLISGCCGGRTLFVTEEGLPVYFPSQIAEMVNGLILFSVLLVLAFKLKKRGSLYSWYLVLYGSTRFILNFFRNPEPVFLGLSTGSFWALLSLAIGIAALVIWRGKIKRKENAEQES